MSDASAKLAALLNRAIGEGSKVVAIAAILPLIEQLAYERDRREQVADDLAEGIAQLTDVELSADDPWGTALAASYANTWDGAR